MNGQPVELAGLLPHTRGMQLVETLTAFDASRASARTASHRRPDHPLKLNGRLPGVCAIEYAAQVMAAHGALGTRDGAAPPTAGYIASVREVRVHVARLDDLADDLSIEVERLAASDRQVMYRFSVSAGGRPVADGRSTVVLDTGLPA